MHQVNYNGMRKRDTYDEIVNSLETETFKLRYPDRRATFMNNSPQVLAIRNATALDIDETNEKINKHKIIEHMVNQMSANTKTHHAFNTHTFTQTPPPAPGVDSNIQANLDEQKAEADEEVRARETIRLQKVAHNIAMLRSHLKSSVPQTAASSTAYTQADKRYIPPDYFQGDDFQSVVDDNDSFKSVDDDDSQSFYSASDKRGKGRPSGSRDGLGVERPNKKQIDELKRINEEMQKVVGGVINKPDTKPDESMNEAPQLSARDRSRSRTRGVKDTTRRRGRPSKAKADEPKPDEPKPDEPKPDEPKPDEPKPEAKAKAKSKAKPKAEPKPEKGSKKGSKKPRGRPKKEQVVANEPVNIEEAPKVKRRLREKTTDKDNLFAVLGEEAPKERRRLTKKTKDENNVFKKPKEKTRLTKKTTDTDNLYPPPEEEKGKNVKRRLNKKNNRC